MSEQPVEKATVNTLASELFEIRKLIAAREKRRLKAGLYYLFTGIGLFLLFGIGMVMDQITREQGGKAGYASGYLFMLALVFSVVGIAKQVER